MCDIKEGLPKVCFLLPSHWSVAMGGAEFQARELLQIMHLAGKYDIYFFARDVGANLNHQSHKVIKISGPHMLRKYGQFVDACNLLKQLDAIRPDIIYQRVGCAYTGIAAHYAKKSKCKLVWHVSSTRDVTPVDFSLAEAIQRPLRFLDKKILEYGIRNISEIITQTEDQRYMLKKNYSKDATRLVRNFVEVPKLVEKKDEPVKVLWIGNLKPLKQPYVFVDLANKLAIPGEVEFSMIGAAFHAQSLQQDFEDRVNSVNGLHYLGRLSQEEVNQQLASAHVLVNTSVFEGFSNTFIQAWMHCVPVVSLNVNPDQLLSEKKLGIFSGEVRGLTKDVLYLCSDTQVRAKMGQQARQFAIDHFSMKNAELLEGYLADLLQAEQVNQDD